MMAITALRMPAPRAAVITRARITVGNASIRSVARIIVSSATPPTNPAMAPTSVPSTAARTTAPMPTGIEMRAPYRMRLRMSRPRASVPSQWPAVGGASRPAMSCSSGS